MYYLWSRQYEVTLALGGVGLRQATSVPVAVQARRLQHPPPYFGRWYYPTTYPVASTRGMKTQISLRAQRARGAGMNCLRLVLPMAAVGLRLAV